MKKQETGQAWLQGDLGPVVSKEVLALVRSYQVSTLVISIPQAC